MLEIEGTIWGEATEFKIYGDIGNYCSLPRDIGIKLIKTLTNIKIKDIYNKEDKVSFIISKDNKTINTEKTNLIEPNKWNYNQDNSIVNTIGKTTFYNSLVESMGFSIAPTLSLNKVKPIALGSQECNREYDYIELEFKDGNNIVIDNYFEGLSLILMGRAISVNLCSLEGSDYIGSTIVNNKSGGLKTYEVINKNFMTPAKKTPVPYDIDMKVRTVVDMMREKLKLILKDFKVDWIMLDNSIRIVGVTPITHTDVSSDNEIEWLDYYHDEGIKSLYTLIEVVKSQPELNLGINIIGHLGESSEVVSVIRNEGISYKFKGERCENE